MSIGYFFAPAFCAFRFASFLHKCPPQKNTGYMGVISNDMLKKLLNIFKSKELEWYEPEDPTPREQCPCCDYISLPERNNYLICPICFWEDEGQDVDDLDESSGPNRGMSLREGRENFKAFGSCEKEMLKNVISVEERNNFEYKPRNL